MAVRDDAFDADILSLQQRVHDLLRQVFGHGREHVLDGLVRVAERRTDSLEAGERFAGHDHRLEKHRFRADPESVFAVFLSIDDQFLFGFAMTCDSEHRVFGAFVVAISSGEWFFHAVSLEREGSQEIVGEGGGQAAVFGFQYAVFSGQNVGRKKESEINYNVRSSDEELASIRDVSW